MLNRHFIVITLLSLTVFSSSMLNKQRFLHGGYVIENNPPLVKITSPQTNTSVAKNATVPYSIDVSDKEDGEAKYQEIVPVEVFLEIKLFEDQAKATSYMREGVSNDHPGLSAIKKSDCFNCHNFKSRLIGPSFVEISKRYRSDAIRAHDLVSHVKNGVSGIWGDAAMPAHPELEQTIIDDMVQWILQSAGDSTLDYHRGLEGTFRCNSPGTIYVLTASYNDHGTKENPRLSLKGQDRVMINESKN